MNIDAYFTSLERSLKRKARLNTTDATAACRTYDSAGSQMQLIWSPSHLDRLLALLDAGDPPTALFGLRDVDVWEIREELRRVRPDILTRLAFVGQGDTPWSQASHPPFTTLNWWLDEIAPLACGIVRDLEAGKTFRNPVVRLIPPRLEVR